MELEVTMNMGNGIKVAVGMLLLRCISVIDDVDVEADTTATIMLNLLWQLELSVKTVTVTARDFCGSKISPVTRSDRLTAIAKNGIHPEVVYTKHKRCFGLGAYQSVFFSENTYHGLYKRVHKVF